MDGLERFRDKIVYDFSTKHGGVSTGIYASMNLSFSMGDDPEKVTENYRLWCEGLGVDYKRTVLLSQMHTTNVVRVDETNCGEGLFRKRQQYTDGMVTNCKGIALITYHADCVPLYFYDPVHEAIGMAHAGWRGTVGGMAQVMASKMKDEFGSAPEELYTRIGPCISQKYFECDSDVVDEVAAMPVWDMLDLPASSLHEVPGYDRRLPEEICTFDEAAGKYHVSLSRLNKLVMEAAGVPAEQIDMADACTYEHDELYFSHRRQGRARGGQAAMLMLKE